VVAVYFSPADPTAKPADRRTLSSYAANAQLFSAAPTLPASVPDGTSNTIAFAEHYAVCSGTRFLYESPAAILVPQVRRATFADGGTLLGYQNAGDVYPVSTGVPPMTVGSDATKTFQVAPPTVECDPSIAQTPHRGGMLVGLADGSVRVCRRGVNPVVYWSAVTPSSGEAIELDW
jgi:hypothetical protein